MNERILQLLITAKNTMGPGVSSAQKAVKAFSSGVKNSMNSVRNIAKRAADSFRKNWLGVTIAIFALQRAFKGLKSVINEFGIAVSASVENLKIRLNAALQSVDEGNKLFSKMEQVAGNVAFQYEEIINSATTLSSVFKGGRREVEKFIPVVLDLAAFSGLSVQETTSQIVRMYSAGAASADLFRERGILAMLGFQAGVSVSAKETRARLLAAWSDSESKFRDLSKKLGGTWDGLMSMFQDRFFIFKKMIGEAGFFDKIKEEGQALLQLIDNLKKTGQLKEIARGVSNAFIGLITASKNFIVAMIIGGNQVIDIWNEFALLLNSTVLGFAKLKRGIQFIKAYTIGTEEAVNAFLLLDDAVKELEKTNTQLAEKAIKDYSSIAEDGVNEFTRALENARQEVAKTKEDLSFMESLQAPADLSTSFRADFSSLEQFNMPSIPKPSADLEFEQSINEARLAMEQDYWAEKLQIAMEGNKEIMTLAENATALKGELKDLEAIKSLKIQQQEIDAVLNRAAIEEATEKKLMAKRELFAKAELVLVKKLQAERIAAVASASTSVLQQTSNLLGALGGENKKYAKIQQGIAMSMAIINTAQGVTKAFAEHVWPFSMVVAGIVGAAGALEVATIASQGFARGTDSVPANLSPGEMVIPRTFASAIRSGDLALSGGSNGGTNNSISINMENVRFNREDDVEEIFQDLLVLMDENSRSKV